MNSQSFAHSRSLTFATSALALGGMIFGAGCSAVPTEELRVARESVQEALESGADQYAVQELAQAQQALADLDKEIEAQERKSAFTRNYDTTLDLADAARTAGEHALSVAAQTREAAKVEARMSLEDARVALDRARGSLGGTPTGQSAIKTLEPLRTELDLLQTSLSALETSFEAGDYLSTKPKAEDARRSAERIGSEIAKAIEAARKKPARRG